MAARIRLALACWLLHWAAAEHKAELLTEAPEWLKPCRRKNPNEDDCIKGTLQRLFPAMAVGIPEVGLPRFEPLYIERIGLQKGHGAVTIAGSFQHILAHGPSNATTTFAKLDIDNKRFDFGIDIPELRLEADYNLKGNILLLPLIGSGDAKLRLRNTTTTASTTVEFLKVDGREVMHVSHMKVDFVIRGMHVHLGNLFNGNKVLGHTLNTFLNKNAQEVVNDLKEPIGESLSLVFMDLMNQLFHHIPTDLWLL